MVSSHSSLKLMKSQQVADLTWNLRQDLDGKSPGNIRSVDQNEKLGEKYIQGENNDKPHLFSCQNGCVSEATRNKDKMGGIHLSQLSTFNSEQLCRKGRKLISGLPIRHSSKTQLSKYFTPHSRIVLFGEKLTDTTQQNQFSLLKIRMKPHIERNQSPHTPLCF